MEDSKSIDKDYEARKTLSLQAFEKGCVIFSSTSGKFYTPREFLDSGEQLKVLHSGVNSYTNWNLHYPKSAIGKKLEDLQKAQKDFDEFMTKMMTAFDLHPVNPGKGRKV